MTYEVRPPVNTQAGPQRKEGREMWEGDVSATEFRWYKTTCGKMLVAGPVITVVVLVLLVFSAENSARKCDETAANDVAHLQTVLARLVQELDDEGCDTAEVMRGLSEDHLKYPVGPYYGWRGTAAKCKVLMRIEGNEVRRCAERGTRPNADRERRLIYRAAILGKAVLDPVEERCSGRQYGYLPDHFYFASMVQNKRGKCSLGEPVDETFYQGPIRSDYQRELERYRKK